MPDGREGKVIMKSKRLVGIFAVISLVALSATAAQAGAGGTPSALTSFFLCRTINGDAPGQSVDVQAFDTDPANAGIGWGFILKGVRLGSATLACSFAKLYPKGSGGVTAAEIAPNPDKLFKDLKCYSISVPRSQTDNGTPPSYGITDGLFPGGLDSNVPGSGLQYICAPATISPEVQ